MAEEEQQGSDVIPVRTGEAVGKRIAELCRRQDLTISKPSSISRVTQFTVSNIVNGRNHSAASSTIKKLGDAFRVTRQVSFASDLFTGPEADSPQHGADNHFGGLGIMGT